MEQVIDSETLRNPGNLLRGAGMEPRENEPPTLTELGLEYGTDWEKEKIEELLGSRWANGRFTVVATNKDISELPERIRHLSRWVKNEAGDFRQTRGR